MATNHAHDAVEAAIADLQRLRTLLERNSAQKVRGTDERAVAKATALAWFNNHRAAVAARISPDDLAPIDEQFKAILAVTDKAATRKSYFGLIKQTRQRLVSARAQVVMPPAGPPTPTPDTPPAFAALVVDPAMQAILARRWVECSNCLAASAPLAATVMMGGLLEALLLAKVNSQPSLAPVFTAKTAPKDRKSGNTPPLSEWTLKNYTDVAHELRWITQSARDIGNVLRDYRNYVHPQKELSHGITLSGADASLFWEITKNIARQLL